MANVKKGSSSGVPSCYEGTGFAGKPKLPPETISSQLSHASGKAGMNFKHPPLEPDQVYEDGEGKHQQKPEHRSTSGAPGHTITGV